MSRGMAKLLLLDGNSLTYRAFFALPTDMATASVPDPDGAAAEQHSTISGIPLEPLYTPETTPIDYGRDLGDPGSYPFTRGVYESMYRGRTSTMR